MKLAFVTLVITSSFFGGSIAAQEVESYKKSNGEIGIVRFKDQNAMVFNLQSVRGQNQCTLEGSAVFPEKNRAAYTSDDVKDACVAIFRFSGKKVTVTTKSCESRCGLNAADTMDGTYVLAN